MFKHPRRKQYRTWVAVVDTILVLATGWWIAVIIPREILQHRPQ